jgi:hypothetical protein
VLRHQRVDAIELLDPLQTEPVGSDRKQTQCRDKQGSFRRDWKSKRIEFRHDVRRTFGLSVCK